MNRIIKTYHNPPHIYLDNHIFIVTSCTYNKMPYFNTDERKILLYTEILNAFEKISSKLFAWVILDNHYHILFEINRGRELGGLIKLINGKSSHEINRLDNCVGRKIWYNYWDTCIRNEKDFYIRMNYIHNNPIKHGYVKIYEDLPQYKFSSFSQYLMEKGKDWLDDVFRRYPIIDFTEKGEP
ncbi:MAG: REP-associated tyrosine transposase [bacterium]